jgi:acyl-CoA thioester hydrolase
MDRLGILDEVIARVPRVHISLDFRRFLRFWDEVEVAIRVAEMGESSVSYAFQMRVQGDIAAEGRAVAVLVTEEGKPTPWSDEHRRLLLGAGPLKA